MDEKTIMKQDNLHNEYIQITQNRIRIRSYKQEGCYQQLGVQSVFEKYSCSNQPIIKLLPQFYGSNQMVKAQTQQRFFTLLLTLRGRLFGSIIFASYDFIHPDDKQSKEWKDYVNTEDRKYSQIPACHFVNLVLPICHTSE